MHYYKHHIGDFIKDTAHLTMIEEGAYRRLLDVYYLCDGDIPQETQMVFRRLRVFTDEEKKAVETVLAEFFTKDENDNWRHTRCDKEIASYIEKSEKNKENGRLGGRPKKTETVSIENQEESETKGNSLTTNHKPIMSSPETVAEKWTAEDRRIAKQILEGVKAVAPSVKGGKNWPDDVRLLRERDGHSHEEILAMFQWANNDDFWRANILSPKTLRKQWTKLEAKRNQAAKATVTPMPPRRREL